MVRAVVAGLAALLSPACALQALPMPISKLSKMVTSQDRSNVPSAEYTAYTLSVPVDHFHNDTKYEPHSDDSFDLHYWFDDQFYKPGGPVFVLSAGEASGEGRLDFLKKGIVHEMAKATGGLGVVLEHRYYGESMPVPDYSTEYLRFLTTDQALADTAYFAQNVAFEGLEDVDLSPGSTPWIAYGGSYAGAFVAFLRVVYPDVFFGAISSSGVPQAIWDYWEYFEAARIYAPPKCSETTGKLTHIVDNILLKEENAKYVKQLKKAFNMSGVTDNGDFASTISQGVGYLQSYNWDPKLTNDSFFDYCEVVSADSNLYPELEDKRASVEELIKVAGYEHELDPLADRMLNYIGSLGHLVLSSCEQSQDECFGTDDPEFYARADISQSWRAWPYQYCTEWGFLQTGSGAPDDILPMVSRAIDLEYSSRVCVQAFNITQPANVSNVNKHGGFDISYPRLAFLDGEWDPWRAAGVHALSQPKRNSTMSEPMILIDDAVHHWDENGVFPNETTPNIPPKAVRDAKREIRDFVQAWLKEWDAGL